MARGNGKQAQEAIRSGKLSKFVRKEDGPEDLGGASSWVDWSEVSAPLIAGAVWAANKEGGALMFGHSRDKRNYAIRIYDGDAGSSYYFPCTSNGLDELETFLRGIIEITEGA